MSVIAQPNVYCSEATLLPRAVASQMYMHVLAYGEMLHSWNLLQKKAELFKSTKGLPILGEDPQNTLASPYLSTSFCIHNRALPNSRLAISRLCQKCSTEVGMQGGAFCRSCSRTTAAKCVVCRLPIRGKFELLSMFNVSLLFRAVTQLSRLLPHDPLPVLGQPTIALLS